MEEKTIQVTETKQNVPPPPAPPGYVSRDELNSTVEAAVRAILLQQAKNRPVDVHVQTPGVSAEQIPSLQQTITDSINEAVRKAMAEAMKNSQPTATVSAPPAPAPTTAVPSSVSELEKRLEQRLAQLEASDKNGKRLITIEPGQPIPKDAALVLPLNADQQQVFFGMMEKNGYIKQSVEMQGKKYENTWKDKGHAFLETRITVRHVGYIMLAGGILWLVYEGLAYAFDWPGLLHDSNPAGADTGGGRRLRAAA